MNIATARKLSDIHDQHSRITQALLDIYCNGYPSSPSSPMLPALPAFPGLPHRVPAIEDALPIDVEICEPTAVRYAVREPSSASILEKVAPGANGRSNAPLHCRVTNRRKKRLNTTYEWERWKAKNHRQKKRAKRQATLYEKLEKIRTKRRAKENAEKKIHLIEKCKTELAKNPRSKYHLQTSVIHKLMTW